eukprot:jgi/Mesvir1/17706/Mv18988-RA.1
MESCTTRAVGSCGRHAAILPMVKPAATISVRSRGCTLPFKPTLSARNLRFTVGVRAQKGEGWDIKYLYDGECSLRRPEVDMLKRMDTKGKIEFCDISAPDYNPLENQGITYEVAMGPPHAILADGTVITNVEVYRKLYEAVGLGAIWGATKLPLVRPVVDWVFDVWADRRLQLTGRPPLADIVNQRRQAFATAGGPALTMAASSPEDNWLQSPLGKAVSSLSELVATSPLNNLKMAIAGAQAGGYDKQNVQTLIDKHIQGSPVMVFSWSRCPFCIKAKNILNELGAKYTALELDEMGEEGKAIRAQLAVMTGRTSVPNIFINGKGIGGCNDGPGITTLLNQGKLVPMLKECGAL